MFAVLLLIAQWNLDARTGWTEPHMFEVASVRPCQNSQSPSGGDPAPGRLHLACVTAANLIRLAYLIFPTGEPNAPFPSHALQTPISGGPAWLTSDLYTIDAKAEHPVNSEMMKGPMMQALLEDRFGLKLHKETVAVPAFCVDGSGRRTEA